MRRVDLVKASREGNLDKVKKILSEGGEYKHNELDIALSYSFQNGDRAIVIELLKFGANIDRVVSKNYFELYCSNIHNCKSDCDGLNILLYHYSKYGDIELVELLIDSGVCINSSDKYNKTALMYASENGHIEIVNLLLLSGAKINATDKYNKTALMYAIANGHIEVFKFLIDSGADINIKNIYGTTALMYASVYGYIDATNLLVDSGADVNIKDIYGTTASMYANVNGHKEIVDILKKVEVL